MFKHSNYAELVFLAEEIANLQGTVQALPKEPLTPLAPSLKSASSAGFIRKPMDVERYKAWLLEGPDYYDTFDETITSTQERSYIYSPSFVIWALSVKNTEAAGGNNLLLRLTSTTGRVKQYRIQANTPFSVDIKGGFDQMRLIAREGTVAVIGFVSLKKPFTP